MKLLSLISLILNFSLCPVLSLLAQTQAADVEAPEIDPVPATDVAQAEGARDFDFWVGTWNLTWVTPDGDIARGTNVVEWVLDGKVLQENFDGGPSMPLIGKSWSVYVPQQKVWKQTWVDNNGSYLDFTGGRVADEMVLSRNGFFRQEPVIQRMRFYDIEEDSFMWIWEVSRDEGESWAQLWRIEYERAAATNE